MPRRNTGHSRTAALPPPCGRSCAFPAGRSRLTGFSERVIAAWEKGKAISEPGLRRLREIERLLERLGEVVQPEAVPQWLEVPNPAFEGLKPLEVIERGEVDRLWTMLFYLESGVA